MFNPSGDELDELQFRAIRSPGAAAAFDAYVNAIAERDELLDDGQDTTAVEAKIKTARERLDSLISGTK